MEKFKRDIKNVWYDLSIDESVCQTVYAIAFNADKTNMVSHLKTDRLNLAKFRKELDAEGKVNAKKEIEGNKLLIEVFLREIHGLTPPNKPMRLTREAPL